MRLIDADKIEPEDFYDCVNFYECMEVINEQPTAYDVDAVVRELEELKMAEYDDSDEEPCYEDAEDIYEEGVSAGKFKAYHKAIEIVKRGGRNDCV